ncbi:hypothetical protein OG792_32855 [Micromonospora sp. NBC_01699]|uniref:hypothetical protein n=1 Tax=Micromonospora sp. NBC_01699 TaxID=2975984 RepID=UPI002E28062A|nr:hypothetical protein [Micromonospora sp. NBC_01699]
MAWDSVPWFVGGGAEHSPEVARLLAYSALNGNEGVLGVGDLKVRALSVPGAGVRVMPGACSILNRATGGAFQTYAARLISEDTVPTTPTGSGGNRSDLVVARIEDPTMPGEPWQDPTDAKVGPYVFTRVVPNVPANTRTVAQLGLGYSAIALARIDFPPSTGTATDAMIVDLRKVANPRRERRVLISSPSTADNLTEAAYRDWPTVAVKSVEVPAWATQVRIITTLSGVVAINNRVDGIIRHRFGATFGQDTRYDTNSVTTFDALDKTMMTADVLSVPASYRGTTQAVAVQGAATYRGPAAPFDGTLQAYDATTIVTDIEFVEVPE